MCCHTPTQFVDVSMETKSVSCANVALANSEIILERIWPPLKIEISLQGRNRNIRIYVAGSV